MSSASGALTTPPQPVVTVETLWTLSIAWLSHASDFWRAWDEAATFTLAGVVRVFVHVLRATR